MVRSTRLGERIAIKSSYTRKHGLPFDRRGRAASLSRALPSQAAIDYRQAVVAELAELPTGIAGTEVELMVRLRVGQNEFRDAIMDYWGGACALTGMGIQEVLRASHAKLWAECATDAE